jgi:hypothetical protein
MRSVAHGMAEGRIPSAACAAGPPKLISPSRSISSRSEMILMLRRCEFAVVRVTDNLCQSPSGRPIADCQVYFSAFKTCIDQASLLYFVHHHHAMQQGSPAPPIRRTASTTVSHHTSIP